MVKSSWHLLNLILLAFSVACGSSSSNGESTTNGVDDVVKACQIRAGWTHGSAVACTQCMIRAPAPRCPCDQEDYPGKCNEQQVAKNNEPTCKLVDDCIDACAPTNCTCIEACYDGKAACRPLGDAIDGCIAATCDAYCR